MPRLSYQMDHEKIEVKNKIAGISAASMMLE
jgi:hypothetical protein